MQGKSQVNGGAKLGTTETGEGRVKQTCSLKKKKEPKSCKNSGFSSPGNSLSHKQMPVPRGREKGFQRIVSSAAVGVGERREPGRLNCR